MSKLGTHLACVCKSSPKQDGPHGSKGVAVGSALSLCDYGIPVEKKKILIVDEEGFGKVCSALLQMDGFRAERLGHLAELNSGIAVEDYGLIITSYPYGSHLFDRVRGKDIPMLVLSDCLNNDLLEDLKAVDKSYCMVKPIDYDKFNDLVGQMLSGTGLAQGGCKIV